MPDTPLFTRQSLGRDIKQTVFAMWREGRSAAEISDATGLAPRQIYSATAAARRKGLLPQTTRSNANRPLDPADLTDRQVAAFEEREWESGAWAVPDMKCLPIEELGPRSCRYPLWGPRETHGLYCGKGTDGGSWCEHHRRIVSDAPEDEDPHRHDRLPPVDKELASRERRFQDRTPPERTVPDAQQSRLRSASLRPLRGGVFMPGVPSYLMRRIKRHGAIGVED